MRQRRNGGQRRRAGGWAVPALRDAEYGHRAPLDLALARYDLSSLPGVMHLPLLLRSSSPDLRNDPGKEQEK